MKCIIKVLKIVKFERWIYLIVPLLIFFIFSSTSVIAQTITDSVDSASLAEKKNRQIKFVKAILASTKDVWYKLFNDQLRKFYEEPKVIFYSGKIESTCSYKINTGPFYCANDKTIYVDLNFYDELISRFPSFADFAMIYLVTHEVGHHVQNLIGNSEIVGLQENEMNEIDINNINVSFELQADFYSGVWAHYNQKVKNLILAGNIEDALYAVSVIGADRLQKIQQGVSVPDGFNHGTSDQRLFWFNKGFTTGDIFQGDTYR